MGDVKSRENEVRDWHVTETRNVKWGGRQEVGNDMTKQENKYSPFLPPKNHSSNHHLLALTCLFVWAGSQVCGGGLRRTISRFKLRLLYRPVVYEAWAKVVVSSRRTDATRSSDTDHTLLTLPWMIYMLASRLGTGGEAHARLFWSQSCSSLPPLQTPSHHTGTPARSKKDEGTQVYATAAATRTRGYRNQR